jgi:hypothetical protein
MNTISLPVGAAKAAGDQKRNLLESDADVDFALGRSTF